MASHPTVVEFDTNRREEILAAMKEMKAAQGGWVNMSPAVDVEDLPEHPGPKLWSARGPLVPLCTWTPPAKKGTAPPVLIGIQHGAGGKAVPRLRDLGVLVPEKWRVQSDHTRRGIVIAAPPKERDDDVLKWLLRAGGMLCDLPYKVWIAEVYAPT
ncbi:MAG TPA: hypothetical protein VM121_11690 [Acidimicrobiales bacterium]|nr:hypothetical protein [Acidimicrobiales bacterium]